jgi:N6-L-threonylcarbamoyladenine synthase
MAVAHQRVILGIESSCDETAAAVVRGRRVLSSVVFSQHNLHEEYAGVVPEIASRAHAERLTPVVVAALREAGVTLGEVEAVAVGHRPGLIGSLLVGVSGAKALAWSLEVPIVAVDHVHAHLFAGCMDARAIGGGDKASDGLAEDGTEGLGGLEGLFPALGLVVSGGHTSVYFLESPTALKRLGATIDDAIGEAYDKLANMLKLGFPGGPLVDRLAAEGNDRAIEFPISRLAPGSLDFSFSGLKTAALYALNGVPQGRPDRPARVHQAPAAADLCASFQRAAVGAVIVKLERALEAVEGPGVKVRSLLVGGGVSANSRLRRELGVLAGRRGLALRLPVMALCVDNAAMIAGLGGEILAARRWAGEALGFAACPWGGGSGFAGNQQTGAGS